MIRKLCKAVRSFYPLWQGFDALATIDLELLKRGGEATDGLWKASQPLYILDLEFA
jgi:hypothetical protein